MFNITIRKLETVKNFNKTNFLFKTNIRNIKTVYNTRISYNETNFLFKINTRKITALF